MINHPNRSHVTDVELNGTSVEFSVGSTRYVYLATKGTLYIGAGGTVIHQAPDGSFDFGGATGNQVAANAQLLGATIMVRR